MFFAAFFITLFILLIIFGVRNELTFRYRTDLLNKVSAAAQDDINNGDYDWRWRYDAMNKVSYHAQASQFWRTFDSFYPDMSFAEKKTIPNDFMISINGDKWTGYDPITNTRYDRD